MSAIISFRNTVKRFGDLDVLRGLDLDVEQGEVFGLLGVNGAGKTTLMRCLLGFIEPNRGEILFKDSRVTGNDIQKRFGFLPEKFIPPANIKAYEFLGILAFGLGVSAGRVDSLLELTGLDSQKNKYIKTYSRGMIQRLGVACALLKDPQVLVMDEPTLGLDPLGQKEMLDLLLTLKNSGKTVFFSSHILSQIERVCTRIGIIHNGVIIYVGRVKEILSKHQSPSLEQAFLAEIEQQ